MREIRRRVAITEIWLANHLGSLGDWWGYRANLRLKRLEKNSGEHSVSVEGAE